MAANKPTLFRKVTYNVETVGDRCTITAHLPPGFTMTTFRRIFILSKRDSLKMSEVEYIEWQRDQLFNDLLTRIKANPLNNRLLK